jgi:DNA transformation protein and related proteins
MAKAPDPFHAFVTELFAGIAPLQIKRMFGGAGVYRDGLMFALLADDVIYLKADEALKRDLKAEGSGPFVWIPDSGPKKGQPHEMGYWRLPEAALDDPDDAVKWARRAVAVSQAAAKVKKPAKKASQKSG